MPWNVPFCARVVLSSALLASVRCADDRNDVPNQQRIVIGVMSSATDAQRRAAIRTTWLAEAREAALRVLFVLGKPASATESIAMAHENKSHGDIVMLPCAENQHRGKTLHWLAYARSMFSDYPYVAKMDQDVYLWPRELQEHAKGFSESAFYGGVKVDTYFHRGRKDRFPFVNGGFVLLSMDLVSEVAALVRSIQPTPEGFLDHGAPWLQGNEDVTLGRALKKRWKNGRLHVNVGDFPWSASNWSGTGASSEYPPGSADFLQRACPWRHAKDLKFASGFERQWKNRGTKGCRCNCPAEYSQEEARITYERDVKRIQALREADPDLPFSTPEEMEEWKAKMKKQQAERNAMEEQRLRRRAATGAGKAAEL